MIKTLQELTDAELLLVMNNESKDNKEFKDYIKSEWGSRNFIAGKVIESLEAYFVHMVRGKKEGEKDPLIPEFGLVLKPSYGIKSDTYEIVKRPQVPKKVYAVMSGCSGDLHVVELYRKKKSAEKHIELNKGSLYEPYIAELDLN